MKEMMVHTCDIAVLDHVDVMTGQDRGPDQDLLVEKVAVETQEMTFTMITTLTEEGSSTGMKKGVVIQWYCYTSLTCILVSDFEFKSHGRMAHDISINACRSHPPQLL